MGKIAYKKYKSFPYPLFKAVFFSLLAGIFLIISFPGPDQGWIVWFSLLPLVLACHKQKIKLRFFLGWIYGLASIIGIFYWVFENPILSLISKLLLAIFFSLYPAFWCTGVFFLEKISLPLFITAPALWVSLEYLKAHAGFFALPWATLAQTQHNNLALIQIASYTGEYGVSFLIVMVNIALFEVIRERKWKSLVFAIIVVGFVWGGGKEKLSQKIKGKVLKVGIVQPNILIEERRTSKGIENSFRRLEQLTFLIAKEKPKLIVWPETAIFDLQGHPEIRERIKRIAEKNSVFIITGASDFISLSSVTLGKKRLVMKVPAYNSAYFISPHNYKEVPSPPYRKNILVPFGEYLPFKFFAKLPSWLVPKLFESIAGKEYRRYILEDKVAVSPIICWENIFSKYVRQLVKKEMPHLIVQLINDNWFGYTAAPYQHNIASVFRAVENRIPIVVASNSGPSQLIDSYGRVIKEVSEIFVPQTLVGEVNLKNEGETFYTKNGDMFTWGCIGFLIIVALTKIGSFYLRQASPTGPRIQLPPEPIHRGKPPH